MIEVLPDPKAGMRAGLIEEMQSDRADDRQQDVNGRPCQRHQRHVAFGPEQAPEHDRHRFGPAEDEWALQEHQQARQQQRADRIDVADWVEAHPAQAAGGVVAEPVGHPGMGGLMQSDRQHHRQKPNRNGVSN